MTKAPVQVRAAITAALEEAGYKVLTDSLHERGQTYFVHLVVTKAGKRFFAKANVDHTRLLEIHTEHLASTLPNGSSFSVVKTVERLSIKKDQFVNIYPYIDLEPVSTERNLDDFKVNDAELDMFLSSLWELLSEVKKKELYSHNDLVKNGQDFSNTLLSWLQKTDPKNSVAIHSLQTLASVPPEPNNTQSLVDLKPQNMFWGSIEKHLYFVDLESVQHKPYFYDHAKFAASLYITSNKVVQTKKWIRLCLLRSIEDSSKTIDPPKAASLQTMLLQTGYEYLIYFRGVDDKVREQRATKFLEWSLYTFAELVNE